MPKLSDDQRSFIALLVRSTDVGDGWRKVGEALVKHTEIRVLANPELFEVDRSDGVKIRLTERGQVVADYI